MTLFERLPRRKPAPMFDALLDKPKDVHPWAPPYDPDTPCPELRCAVTGRVDAADDCTCAGCTAAKVRGR